NSRALTELIKMIGIARWIEMDVGIVSRYPCGLHWRVLFLLSQFLATVIHLLSHQIALLHPAFLPFRVPYSSKTPVAIQHLDALGISYKTCFVVDRGHLVAQDSLRSRNVSDLLHPAASAATG